MPKSFGGEPHLKLIFPRGEPHLKLIFPVDPLFDRDIDLVEGGGDKFHVAGRGAEGGPRRKIFFVKGRAEFNQIQGQA